MGWLLAAIGLNIFLLGLVLQPKSTYSFAGCCLHWFDAVLLCFQILQMGDACRRPMVRIGFKGWTIYLLVFVAMVIAPALLVRQFLVQPFRIPTGAMEPTLMGITRHSDGQEEIGDHILVEKVTYRNRAPKRGDIVVFRASEIEHPYVKKDSFMVKRIVGLPGETISINPPHILADGRRITEPRSMARISERESGYDGYHLARTMVEGARLTTTDSVVRLGETEYFLVGDNSKQSLDSRYFGAIDRSSIVGRVIYVYSPAERKKWIGYETQPSAGEDAVPGSSPN